MRFSTHKVLFSFLLIFFLKINFSFADHIIGGEITVKRYGLAAANTFSVTMIFYRDCGGGGAAFDNPVYVGVYQKGTNTKQQMINMGGPLSVTTVTLGDGCYKPTTCMEKGIYSVSGIVIPDFGAGYYLSWIRCCRNAGMVNILNPNAEGSVFYTEIPNPATYNSSPTFDAIPDGYMCANYTNTDDFSATDSDGDSLSYSFSNPLTCNPTCSSSNPDPNCPTCSFPGPYNTVTWNAGYYTANPMGDPGMIINNLSGQITTQPTGLGLYVLAVIVSEWRGGVQIGYVQRDFEFWVLSCNLLNLNVSPGNPVCLGQTCTLTATGSGGAGTTYLWSSGQTSSSIIVTPTSIGSYGYSVTATYWNTAITPNAWCIKSTNATLILNPNPTASITTSGNICSGQNQTLTASGGIAYSWSNGSPIQDLSVSPGTYSVWVTNAYNCTASTSGTISAPVASSYTWTGGGAVNTADNWFDSNNWGNSFGCIPNCQTDVFIPNSPSANSNNFPDIGTGVGIAACHDIILDQSSKLTFSSTNAELDVCGDFTDRSVIQNNGGQKGIIKFMGTIAQNFTRESTASGNPFYQIILANTAVPLPTLTIKDGINYKDMPISNSGSFIFQSGVLVTEGGMQLRVINNASNAISGHGPTKYICGRLYRNVAVNTSYDFPVGNMPVYNMAYPYELMNINFSALNGVTDITVSFENPILTNATGTGLPVSEITPLSGQWTTLLNNGGTNTGMGYTTAGNPIGGIWTIIPNSYGATPTYSMTLSGRNYGNAGSFEHTILKRNTFCPDIWTANGTYNTSSISGTPPVVSASRTGMSGFSQVVIAKVMAPLPVELVLFDAACDKEKTILSWVTASETNNDYFTIERSCNENFFEYQTIATVPGSGNSNNMREYSFIDEETTSGDCYYRLSQTDYDGKITEFTPININCKENAAFNFVGVLPNPAHDEVNVLFTSISTANIIMNITDMMGKEVLSKNIKPEIGLNKIELSLLDLSSGVYFMNLNNGTKSFVKKVVKKD